MCGFSGAGWLAAVSRWVAEREDPVAAAEEGSALGKGLLFITREVVSLACARVGVLRSVHPIQPQLKED